MFSCVWYRDLCDDRVFCFLFVLAVWSFNDAKGPFPVVCEPSYVLGSSKVTIVAAKCFEGPFER